MTGLAGFSLGIGLAGLCGFRAFFPLILISLVARYSREEFFRSAFQFLSSTWFLLILLFLLAVEILGAKLNSDNSDIPWLLARVLSGAVVFAAVFSDVNIFWGLLFGGIMAGLGAVVDTLLRPVLINSIDGMNQSILASVEDLIAFIGTVLIILLPAISILLISYIIYLAFKRFRQQKRYQNNKRARVLR